MTFFQLAKSAAAVLVSATASFLAATVAHEATHGVQRFVSEGDFGRMWFNPSLDYDVCEGHLACSEVPDPWNPEQFWMGEGLAYAVFAVVFIEVCIVACLLLGIRVGAT